MKELKAVLTRVCLTPCRYSQTRSLCSLENKMGVTSSTLTHILSLTHTYTHTNAFMLRKKEPEHVFFLSCCERRCRLLYGSVDGVSCCCFCCSCCCWPSSPSCPIPYFYPSFVSPCSFSGYRRHCRFGRTPWPPCVVVVTVGEARVDRKRSLTRVWYIPPPVAAAAAVATYQSGCGDGCGC